MSEATQTTSAHANRRSQEAEASASNGQDTANTSALANGLGNVTIEIAGLEVTLPVKFGPGHVLTDSQAKVLDAAYQRQFTNNQNASAKSRAEALEKATTEADRAAKAPLTASAIAALYTDYEPSVGGTRIGSMEKIRNDAAWRMWTAMIADHNASVSQGGQPVIAKAGMKQIPGLKPQRDANGKVTVTVQSQRENLVARILTMPEYAERVQTQVDAILAERGKDRTEVDASNTVNISEDLL
jgi:hypothetical protein